MKFKLRPSMLAVVAIIMGCSNTSREIASRASLYNPAWLADIDNSVIVFNEPIIIDKPYQTFKSELNGCELVCIYEKPQNMLEQTVELRSLEVKFKSNPDSYRRPRLVSPEGINLRFKWAHNMTTESCQQRSSDMSVETLKSTCRISQISISEQETSMPIIIDPANQ